VNIYIRFLDASAENSNSDFEITVTANDLAQRQTPPIQVQKPKVPKSKPSAQVS